MKHVEADTAAAGGSRPGHVQLKLLCSSPGLKKPRAAHGGNGSRRFQQWFLIVPLHLWQDEWNGLKDFEHLSGIFYGHDWNILKWWNMGRNECAEFQSSSVDATHRQTPVHHVPPIQLDLEGSSQSVGRQQGAPVKTHIGLVWLSRPCRGRPNSR